MSAEEPPQNSLRKSDKRSCPSSFQKLLLLFLCVTTELCARDRVAHGLLLNAETYQVIDMDFRA